MTTGNICIFRHTAEEETDTQRERYTHTHTHIDCKYIVLYRIRYIMFPGLIERTKVPTTVDFLVI